MNSRIPLPLVYFLGVWTLLNVLQAGLTPLDPDEAYYWLYSQELAWGYFDHPPMVALLIKAGSSWMPGALGVRLLTVLLMLLTIFLLWKLAGAPRQGQALNLFMLVAAAMPFFHIYGFVATPDAPLLFFSAAWFWVLRQFLLVPTIPRMLLLGLLMALLLYSKYHGVLVIGFSILAHLRLLLSWRFWLSGLIGLLLFLPHLYWQYSQGFPTFSYHLVGRDDAWELKLPLNYLLNQLLIFSPLLFPFLIKALADSLKSRPWRLETWQMIGFWVFFAAMTFKGHVEPQWTAVLSIPVVLLLMETARDNARKALWIRRMALSSLVLLLIARVGIMTGWLQTKKLFPSPAWVFELQDKAEGLPLYFENSYRDASMFAFHTGLQTSTFTNIDYRANQFNLMDWESDFHNKRVMVVGQRKWDCTDCSTDTLSNGHIIKRFVADSLQVSENCRIIVENIPEIWAAEDTITISGVVVNAYPFAVELGKGNLPLQMAMVMHNGKAWETDVVPVHLVLDKNRLEPQTQQKLALSFVVPKIKGSFRVAFGFRMGNLLPSVNSDSYSVIID